MTTPTRIWQAAAIPLRDHKICLVTSKSGRRWVIPKGCLEPGKAEGEIALQEAWEEAGLVGFLHPHPVGSYLYGKCGNTYYVTVFLMEVTTVAPEWPESQLRQRAWLRRGQALAHLTDRGLRSLVGSVLAEDSPGRSLANS
jgi:8-oxo-dGTP pyrophosphatase MutT (NUDIX family)